MDIETSVRYLRLRGEGRMDFREVKGLVNLSASGLWFPFDEELEPFEPLMIEVVLPTTVPVRVLAAAEFVDYRTYDSVAGIAVRFLEMAPTSRDAIATFCIREELQRIRKSNLEEIQRRYFNSSSASC